MTTHKPIKSPGAPDASELPSPAGKLDEDVSVAAAEATGALRAVKATAVVLIGLLVCPPLAVIVFTIVAPFLVVALVLGLLALVLSTPYLLFHHFHGHHGDHLSLLAHRLRRAGRALMDLAPHRIVADARKIASGP
jgi:hypothetical protein